MKFSFLVLIALLVSCQQVICQEIEQEIRSIIDAVYLDNQDAVGMIVHVESPDDSLSFTYAVGFADENQTIKLQPANPVLMASNTKTYIAAAILQLVHNDELDLQQSIDSLLTKRSLEALINAQYDVTSITLEHLLSHSSGITDYVDSTYLKAVRENTLRRWSREEQIDLAMLHKPMSNPGLVYAYGDINFVLLAEILEEKSTLPFNLAVKQLIDFEKHNLYSTWFYTIDSFPSNCLPLAHQYNMKKGLDSYDMDPSWDLYGGGGQASTLSDLAIFFQLLNTNKIIENKILLSKMQTPFELPDFPSNYGFGLQKILFADQVAYYHGGYWGTDVLFLPQCNCTIAAVTLVKDKRELNAKISTSIIELLR